MIDSISAPYRNEREYEIIKKLLSKGFRRHQRAVAFIHVSRNEKKVNDAENCGH